VKECLTLKGFYCRLTEQSGCWRPWDKTGASA